MTEHFITKIALSIGTSAGRFAKGFSNPASVGKATKIQDKFNSRYTARSAGQALASGARKVDDLLTGKDSWRKTNRAAASLATRKARLDQVNSGTKAMRLGAQTRKALPYAAGAAVGLAGYSALRSKWKRREEEE